MATREQLYAALQRADAAGDAEAARAIARRLASMQTAAPAPKPEPMRTGGEMATEGMGIGERLLAGIGRGAVDVVQGAEQLGDRLAQFNPASPAFWMEEGQRDKAKSAYDAKVADEARLFDDGLGQTTSGTIGRVLGNVVATAPLGVAGGGIRGAMAAGGAAGALQPVTGGDFAGEKLEQIGLGALGGGAVAGLLKGGKVTVGAVKTLAGKLRDSMPNVTQAARERAAADILRKAAADQSRLAGAANPRQFVQGTQQTLAEATDDAGISGLQRTMASMSPDFNNRLTTMGQQNNAARVDAIRGAFGGADEAAAQRIEQVRDQVTAPLLKQAQQVKGVNTTPVVELIDDIIQSRQGRPAVQGAAKRVRDLLTADGMDSVQRLHNVRQAIGDMLADMSPDGSAAKAASRELMAIKRRLDVQIGKASPEFRQFLSEFAERSRDAGRVRMGDELLGKSSATLDAAGNPVLSPAQFGRAADNLDRVAKQATGFRRETADRLMTPEQRDTVGAVRADLDRYARTQTQGRAVGSNTVQNAVGVGRLQDELGGSDLISAIAPRAANPLNVLNAVRRYYGNQVLEVVQEAMLNPAEAARILSRLPPQQQQAARQLVMSPRLRLALEGVARGGALAGASGAVAAGQSQQP
jgi:hypothetical protein